MQFETAYAALNRRENGGFMTKGRREVHREFSTYFFAALRFAAHRAFIMSDNFLRPAAVNPP